MTITAMGLDMAVHSLDNYGGARSPASNQNTTGITLQGIKESVQAEIAAMNSSLSSLNSKGSTSTSQSTSTTATTGSRRATRGNRPSVRKHTSSIRRVATDPAVPRSPRTPPTDSARAKQNRRRQAARQASQTPNPKRMPRRPIDDPSSPGRMASSMSNLSYNPNSSNQNRSRRRSFAVQGTAGEEASSRSSFQVIAASCGSLQTNASDVSSPSTRQKRRMSKNKPRKSTAFASAIGMPTTTTPAKLKASTHHPLRRANRRMTSPQSTLPATQTPKRPTAIQAKCSLLFQQEVKQSPTDNRIYSRPKTPVDKKLKYKAMLATSTTNTSNGSKKERKRAKQEQKDMDQQVLNRNATNTNTHVNNISSYSPAARIQKRESTILQAQEETKEYNTNTNDNNWLLFHPDEEDEDESTSGSSSSGSSSNSHHNHKSNQNRYQQQVIHFPVVYLPMDTTASRPEEEDLVMNASFATIDTLPRTNVVQGDYNTNHNTTLEDSMQSLYTEEEETKQEPNTNFIFENIRDPTPPLNLVRDSLGNKANDNNSIVNGTKADGAIVTVLPTEESETALLAVVKDEALVSGNGPEIKETCVDAGNNNNIDKTDCETDASGGEKNCIPKAQKSTLSAVHSADRPAADSQENPTRTIKIAADETGPGMPENDRDKLQPDGVPPMELKQVDTASTADAEPTVDESPGQNGIFPQATSDTDKKYVGTTVAAMKDAGESHSITPQTADHVDAAAATDSIAEAMDDASLNHELSATSSVLPQEGAAATEEDLTQAGPSDTATLAVSEDETNATEEEVGDGLKPISDFETGPSADNCNIPASGAVTPDEHCPTGEVPALHLVDAATFELDVQEEQSAGASLGGAQNDDVQGEGETVLTASDSDTPANITNAVLVDQMATTAPITTTDSLGVPTDLNSITTTTTTAEVTTACNSEGASMEPTIDMSAATAAAEGVVLPMELVSVAGKQAIDAPIGLEDNARDPGTSAVSSAAVSESARASIASQNEATTAKPVQSQEPSPKGTSNDRSARGRRTADDRSSKSNRSSGRSSRGGRTTDRSSRGGSRSPVERSSRGHRSLDDRSARSTRSRDVSSRSRRSADDRSSRGRRSADVSSRGRRSADATPPRGKRSADVTSPNRKTPTNECEPSGKDRRSTQVMSNRSREDRSSRARKSADQADHGRDGSSTRRERSSDYRSSRGKRSTDDASSRGTRSMDRSSRGKESKEGRSSRGRRSTDDVSSRGKRSVSVPREEQTEEEKMLAEKAKKWAKARRAKFGSQPKEPSSRTLKDASKKSRKKKSLVVPPGSSLLAEVAAVMNANPNSKAKPKKTKKHSNDAAGSPNDKAKSKRRRSSASKSMATAVAAAAGLSLPTLDAKPPTRERSKTPKRRPSLSTAATATVEADNLGEAPQTDTPSKRRSSLKPRAGRPSVRRPLPSKKGSSRSVTTTSTERESTTESTMSAATE